MDIQQIKDQTKQINLAFVRQFEADNVTPTPWLSHWDNDKRIRVTAHQDVIEKLKENPSRKDLAIKVQNVEEHGEVKSYVRYVLILPNNIEYSI